MLYAIVIFVLGAALMGSFSFVVTQSIMYWREGKHIQTLPTMRGTYVGGPKRIKRHRLRGLIAAFKKPKEQIASF